MPLRYVTVGRYILLLYRRHNLVHVANPYLKAVAVKSICTFEESSTNFFHTLYL